MPAKHLPPEVWHIIFRFATGPLLPHVLGLQFISPLDMFVDLDMHWLMLGDRDFTRTSLALVCHSWRVMATPYIYEQIVLKSLEQGKLLIRTLENAKQRLDHHIKAIFMDFALYTEREPANANKTNSSIMKYMTELKVYGIRCSYVGIYPAGCAGLTTLCPPVACHPTSMIIRAQHGVLPSSLHSFLASAGANLRILELSLPNCSPSNQLKHNRLLLLPNLHTLSIIGGGDATALLGIASHWLVPSLRCIRGLGHTASFPLTNFSSSPQLSYVAPRVTSVAFSGPRVCNNFYEIFPGIEEIVFDVDVDRYPVMMMKPVPTCTQVGILVYDVREPQLRKLATAISDQFTPLSNPVTFPKLRLIRVMFVPAKNRWITRDSRSSATFFSDYERRIFWAYWKMLWASRGVKLEATEPYTGIPVPDTLELEEDLDELASAYERIWEPTHVGHGEDSSSDSVSEDSWGGLSSDEIDD